MFTGLVEAVATVAAVAELDDGRRLSLAAPSVREGVEVGDSVAVDGACLTVVELTAEGFAFDVIGTTLSRTVAGDYEEGVRVNVERALRLGDRLGGHMVQGHVDGVGVVAAVRRRGEHHLLDVRVPPEVAGFTVLHGSIAFNGVSLTVNALPAGDVVQVGLVPHTWENTTLSDLREGSRVNVEADLIGKYVGRLVAPWRDAFPHTPGGS